MRPETERRRQTRVAVIDVASHGAEVGGENRCHPADAASDVDARVAYGTCAETFYARATACCGGHPCGRVRQQVASASNSHTMASRCGAIPEARWRPLLAMRMLALLTARELKHFTRVHLVRDMDALVAQITRAETSLGR